MRGGGRATLLVLAVAALSACGAVVRANAPTATPTVGRPTSPRSSTAANEAVTPTVTPTSEPRPTPANLGAQLASIKTHVPGQIGLLVMTDEEGGGVQRMANLVGWLPWPAWMGSNWSAAQIQAAVTQVGSKMSADGVNMDLAPVIDVDGTNAAPSGTNPDGWRSFSGNTAVVSKDGIAFMNGLRSAGVIPVLKHFPGLGGSTGNTDNGSAQTLPWTTLQQVAIPPFAAAIAAGAPAVMVSNATVPGLTTLPASL